MDTIQEVLQNSKILISCLGKEYGKIVKTLTEQLDYYLEAEKKGHLVMYDRPASGSMVYWRMKSKEPTPYKFGYVTYAGGYDMLRMGRWAGDTTGGYIVFINDIDWKPYS